MITFTVFVILYIILGNIFITHHAGNGLQMSNTKVTKDKPVS